MGSVVVVVVVVADLYSEEGFRNLLALTCHCHWEGEPFR